MWLKNVIVILFSKEQINTKHKQLFNCRLKKNYKNMGIDKLKLKTNFKL